MREADFLDTYIPALLSFGMGAYLLLGRSWLASVGQEHNRRWMNTRVTHGQYEMYMIIGGIACILISILIVLGVIRFG